MITVKGIKTSPRQGGGRDGLDSALKPPTPAWDRQVLLPTPSSRNELVSPSASTAKQSHQPLGQDQAVSTQPSAVGPAAAFSVVGFILAPQAVSTLPRGVRASAKPAPELLVHNAGPVCCKGGATDHRFVGTQRLEGACSVGSRSVRSRPRRQHCQKKRKNTR